MSVPERLFSHIATCSGPACLGFLCIERKKKGSRKHRKEDYESSACSYPVPLCNWGTTEKSSDQTPSQHGLVVLLMVLILLSQTCKYKFN